MALTRALTSWQNIEDVLLQAGLAEHEVLTPDHLITHPRNRKALMINSYAMSKKGSKILKMGVDLDHLQKLTAFRMSTDPCQKAAQIEANKKVMDEYMAAINGKKRGLTIACSHTVALFKAIMAGMPTPTQVLQDPVGCLNGPSLSAKDKALGAVITKGVSCFMIDSTVERCKGRNFQDSAVRP